MNTKSVFSSFFVDLMSMKTKSAILWVLIIVGMSVVNMKAISFLFLVRLASLLFLNDEKGVRATNFAPVNKKSSVYGRYMFVLLLFVFGLAINLLTDLIAPVFYEEYIRGSLLFYVLIFVVFIVLASIETPLLYWKGYTKLRIFQYLLFLSLALLTVKVVGEEKLYYFITDFNTNVQVALLLIVAAIVLLLCSLLISIKIYTRKDI